MVNNITVTFRSQSKYTVSQKTLTNFVSRLPIAILSGFKMHRL